MPTKLVTSGLLLLALPLLLSNVPRGTRIAFGPEQGLELEKSFTRSLDLVLDEVSFEVNGESQEVPDVSGTVAVREDFVFADRYLELGDGQPVRLERAFERLTQRLERKATSPDGETNDFSSTDASELEGKAVLFHWRAEEEEYEVGWAPEHEGDEELLEGLEADLDLLGFLPADEVEEGASWEVEIEAFQRLWDPSGELHLVGEDEEEEDLAEQELNQQLDDNVTGEVKATFQETRDVDGRRVAVIQIEVSAASDGSAQLEDESSESRLPEGAQRTREVELETELEGELLWDLEAGHLLSVRLSGSIELVQRDITQLGDGSPAIELVQEVRFSGDAVCGLEFRAAD